MIASPLFLQLHHALASATRVLLVAHQKPDGDTLGSSSAMLNWLLREGKDVTIFCKDVPPESFRYLDNIHRYTNDPSVFDGVYDVVIIFDSGDLRYCGVDTLIPRLPKGYLFANVDHHGTNTRYATLNLVVPDASSTAEIVYRFFDANQIPFDDRMATSILTGLFTDTRVFSNAATTSSSMDVGSKMIAAGARKQDIIRHFFHNKDVPSLKIWGTILSRLVYNARYDIATTYILESDLPTNGASDLTDGVSNFLNAVVGASDTILVLREVPGGEIKGSMRSVTRDISKLAKIFGGGGHKKAAGFTIKGRIHETPDGMRIVAL